MGYQKGGQIRLGVTATLTRRVTRRAGGGRLGALVRGRRVLGLDARLGLGGWFDGGDVEIWMGQSVFATLGGLLQVVDEIRLRKANVRGGRSVQVPEVPTGIRLASKGTLLSETTYENWSHVLEERGQVQFRRTSDTTVLTFQPIRIHQSLSLKENFLT